MLLVEIVDMDSSIQYILMIGSNVSHNHSPISHGQVPGKLSTAGCYSRLPYAQLSDTLVGATACGSGSGPNHALRHSRGSILGRGQLPAANWSRMIKQVVAIKLHPCFCMPLFTIRMKDLLLININRE